MSKRTGPGGQERPSPPHVVVVVVVVGVVVVVVVAIVLIKPWRLANNHCRYLDLFIKTHKTIIQ